MKFIKTAAWVLLAVASASWGQTYTPGQAAAAGKADGVARNPTTAGNINTATGTATVPNYNTTPPEGAYFGGGNGNVAAPTATKLSSCTMATTAECTAINLMQYKASNANPVVINPLDPLVVNAKSVTKTPTPTLGATASIFTAPTSTACAPGTTTTGTGSVIETCEAHGVPTDLSCVKPWDFQIEPWWQYQCEKSNVTVTNAQCTKLLNVEVTWEPNCTVGDVIATGVKPWTFHIRDCGFWGCDDGYWDNGGAVLAYCDPALASSINFSYGGTGRVACGQFGSNPDQRQSVPPPQPNLAAWRTITLPSDIPQSISLPGEAMDVVAGSTCDAGTGQCNFTFHIGDGTWGCDGSHVLYVPPGYCGYNCSTPPQVGGTVVGPNPGAICYPLTGGYAPIVVGYDYGPVYGCSFGDLYTGTWCYPLVNPVPTILVSPSPGATFTMSFQKPRLVPIQHDHIVSTCDGLEASPNCSITGTTCQEGPSTKIINGVEVTRQCWKTLYDYQCTSAAGPNWCAPLAAEPLCAQNAVDECLAYSATNVCISYKAGYRCTKDMGPPTNVAVTGTGYTVVRDALDETACNGLANNNTCTKIGSVCTDTADKTFFGFTFSKACWSYTDTYTCPGTATSDCQPLIDNGCSVIPSKTTCTNLLANGVCDTTVYYYECGSPVTVTDTGATCDATPYCINGICYDTARPSDPDFGKAVAFQEAAREAGNYIDPATFQIFKGEANFCRKRALVNCCKGNGAAAPSLTNRAIYTAVDFGRTYAGSMYMYDTLFASGAPDFLVNGLESLGVTSAVGANTFSAYGVTIGWGPGGFEIVAFDPYTFIAQVIIYIVISELMSCEDAEKVTAVKKDQGICQEMGSWCSSKFLGMCEATTHSYCCFNSKLAKAVSMQGKVQLGISLGSPQEPNCRGLTIDEINSLDFSTIDLSEFIASISANAIGNSDAVTNAVNRLVNPNTSTIPTPVPSGGGFTEGPGSPPPPPPPPPPAGDPTVTATVAPSANLIIGSAFTITTVTANATSLNYACSGATTGTGSLATGTVVTNLTALAGNTGVTTCQYTASNGSASTTIQVQYTIGPPKPTITASFTPNTVPGGSAFSLQTATTNATSVDYVCTGASPSTGTLGTGSLTTPMVASTTNMGQTDCTFNARDGSGQIASVTASYKVTPVMPTITASFFPTTVPVGGGYQLSVTSNNAASVSYTCVGAMAGSGVVPTGAYTQPRTAAVADIGVSTCTYTATSVTGDVASRAITMTVTP